MTTGDDTAARADAHPQSIDTDGISGEDERETAALRAMVATDRNASRAEVERAAAEAPADDAPLVALFREAESVWSTWMDTTIDGEGGRWDELLAAGHAVEQQIVETRAVTLAGVVLKAWALAEVLQDDGTATDWQKAMARSVLADLEGMAAAAD